MRILFTASTYYQNGKLPITISTEERDKLRVKSLSCDNKVITHSLEKLNQQIKTVCILQAMCVPRNFDYAMFLAFLRIYNQILLIVTTTRPITVKA